MMSTLLAAVFLAATLTTTACGNPPPPPASKTDRAGLVMGTKNDQVLMIGIANRAETFERSATPAQIRACTRRPTMAYPACLPPTS
ncbi:hypothetical protein [Nonomuraea ceibae]|uniref:hypothetical protein n=1 Tax=Nonomuraea ceibae TaxID=1935170 RepID=UPI001C6061AF|nr:hypothetical protein [Nonomuraea ceibae]